MRLLPDENLPERLKLNYPDHEVFTVKEKGWTSIKNGRLLQLMPDNGFHALLTFDKNLQHKQNFSRYTLAGFVLHAPINRYIVLTELSPRVNACLQRVPLPAGPIIIKAD